MPDRLRTTTQTRQAIYQAVSESRLPMTRAEIARTIEQDDTDELGSFLDEMVEGDYLKRVGQAYTLGPRSPWH